MLRSFHLSIFCLLAAGSQGTRKAGIAYDLHLSSVQTLEDGSMVGVRGSPERVYVTPGCGRGGDQDRTLVVMRRRLLSGGVG